MTTKFIKTCRYAIIVLSGLIVGLSGLFARITSEPSIEHWFVFAAGLSNMIVVFDLGPEIFRGEYNKSARFLLTFELVLFSVILGVDINLALGNWENLLLIFSLLWVIFALVVMAYSDNPQNQVGFLASALCFIVSLYLMPPLLELIKPEWEHPLWILIYKRGYALIHLLCIPFTYLLIDRKLAKNHDKWMNFLFLDRSLAWAGAACAISGLLYAYFGPAEGTPPLFESGAAALLLLVGNSWYLSIEEQANALQA